MSFPVVVLESATHRTLHAQGFSRSSAQASQVLTDLFSRYLTLLSVTSAKYARQAGRTRLAARDAFVALQDLGVNTDELTEYCASEGRELRRFALHTGRRVEDLNELKAQNADGLRQDEDDAMPLVYAPLLPGTPEASEEDEWDEDAREDDKDSIRHHPQSMDVDVPLISRWSPFLPMSYPSSPIRKRPKPSNWSPPDHIPDFFPPFPDENEVIDRQLAPRSPHMPPVQILPAKIEKPPSPIPQPLTSTSAPDYLTRVPYEQSTLSATPEWHLPEVPLPHPSLQIKPSRTATLQTEPAFIAAYHHILTHPPPPTATYANPSRHKVAMALLARTQIASRWDPPDSLYSNVAPCPPRVAAMSPTFPIPIAKGLPGPVENKAEETKFPTTLGKCVVVQERLSPSVSQPGSRLPELSRAVLSTPVHARTSRLTHPPVLTNNGGQKLVYGTGLPAPWNSTAPTAPPPAPPAKANEGAAINGIVNGKSRDAAKPVLPDALLYATWDYDKKDYRQPLHVSGRRGRVGSVPNPILSLGTRSRQDSQGNKVG